MAITYTALQTVTVGSGGTTAIEFTNIPATYTDLIVKFAVRGSGSSGLMLIRFNDDTGNNYNNRALYFYGSGTGVTGSNSQDSFTFSAIANNAWNNFNADTFSNSEMYISGYATSLQKPVNMNFQLDNLTTAAASVQSGTLWANTAAINKIAIIRYAAETLVENSQATLYGIRNTV